MREPEVSSGAAREKLERIVQKDERSGRTLTGAWLHVLSGFGVVMVLF